jgi:hypothetical protein
LFHQVVLFVGQNYWIYRDAYAEPEGHAASAIQKAKNTVREPGRI